MVVFRARLVRRHASRLELVTAPFVGPVVASPAECPVEGCDCGLTKTEHEQGLGAGAQCSCEVARVAALRAARKVA